MISDFFAFFAKQAESYNLNPLIFIIFKVASWIPWWLGAFLMLKGSGIIKIRWRDIKKLDFSKVNFKNKMAVVGFLMNMISGLIPLAYIVIFGRDMPIGAYFLIFALAALIIALLLRKLLRKKIKK